MGKKSSMQKEVERTEKMEVGVQEGGEQLDLIDTQPENAKAIIQAAQLYRKYQAARQKALVKEVEQKQVILELVKAADLQRLAGGKIKFKCGDLAITITPRDELVQVVQVQEKKKKKEETTPEGEQLAEFTD